MWVSKEQLEQTIKWQNTAHCLQGEADRLRVENARLRADLDWFKLRLNAVEKERAQLIAAAIGVKISVPEFVPRLDADDVLNNLPDVSTVGADAHDDNNTQGSEDGVDYSLMPGYRGK